MLWGHRRVIGQNIVCPAHTILYAPPTPSLDGTLPLRSATFLLFACYLIPNHLWCIPCEFYYQVAGGASDVLGPAAGGAVHLKNPWMPGGGGSRYVLGYLRHGHACSDLQFTLYSY